MKRGKWNRRDYKIAGCVSIVICIAFVALTMPSSLPGAVTLFGMWLWILIATGFFVGWALKNESRWSAFWQAADLSSHGLLFGRRIIEGLKFRCRLRSCLSGISASF